MTVYENTEQLLKKLLTAQNYWSFLCLEFKVILSNNNYYNYRIIEYFPFTLTLPKLYSDANFKMAPKFENYVPIQFKKFILYKYI